MQGNAGSSFLAVSQGFVGHSEQIRCGPTGSRLRLYRRHNRRQIGKGTTSDHRRQVQKVIREASASGKKSVELKDPGERGAGRLTIIVRTMPSAWRRSGTRSTTWPAPGRWRSSAAIPLWGSRKRAGRSLPIGRPRSRPARIPLCASAGSRGGHLRRAVRRLRAHLEAAASGSATQVAESWTWPRRISGRTSRRRR